MQFDPLVSKVATPSAYGWRRSDVCLCMCEPVCIDMLIRSSWITLRTVAQAVPCGDKMDVYSSLQCLHKVKVEGAGGQRRTCGREVLLCACACIFVHL